jgi:energy-coupling factor transporter ATP-binding protein EcfA2
MAMHYEAIQEKFGQCPSPIALGPNDTGKTTAAKAFLSLVGNQEKGLARQLTVAEASLKCASSTIPYVFDDPDKLDDVRVLINNNFNGQVRATVKSTHVPKTTCLYTLNEDKLPRLLTNTR